MKILQKNSNEHKKKGNPIILTGSIFVILVLFGIAYVVNTWITTVEMTEKKAIELAEIAEVSIQKSSLSTLDVGESDLDKLTYHEIKHSLNAIADLDNDIRFAYIMVKKEDGIYFMADSEPAYSEDYSPPGQKYEEADKDLIEVFETGQTTLAGPTKDRWGNWVSVLVPMKAYGSDEVIAILGVDYPAQSWNNHAIERTIQSVFVILCLLSILIILHYIYLKNRELLKERKKFVDVDKKLKESEMLLRTIFDQATIGMAIWKNDNYMLSISEGKASINPTYEKITGRTKEELLEISWIEITHPDDLQLDLKYHEKFKAGEINGYDLEKRYIKPDGSVVWVHMIICPLLIDGSSTSNHLCIIEDISKRKDMEMALYDSERSKAVLLDNLPGMAYRCKLDKDWTMEFISEGCLELTGYKPESLLYNKDYTFNDVISPKYRDYLWDRWTDLLKENGKLKEEYEIITATGAVKWVLEQAQGVFDDNGNVLYLEGLIIDITERKHQEIKLKYYNEHDYLTGLYNRKYFEEILMTDLASKVEEKRAVLLVNLRKFSIVNLTFGYHYGEKLTVELATNLLSLCTQHCFLYQLSTERFIFYVNQYQDKTELELLSDSIMEVVKSTVSSKTMGAVVGIVEIEDNMNNADMLLRKALIAVEHISKDLIFGYRFFDRKMEEAIMREEEIKNELVRAHNLYLEYQPILDLKTNKICAFEALARLKSDVYGNISPGEFIPIAEKTQLIVPLGKRILILACLFIKQLESIGFNKIKISVNVSAIQLIRDDFIPDLIDILSRTKVNPKSLTIELTESIFSDNYKDINNKLKQINDLGIETAIDDFGTGYSSLDRARKLKVNYIKIDKTFIDTLLNMKEEDSVTGDIISLTHKLGHRVVAEGVEHEVQKQYLIKHNCDFMQGYLFSKPLSDEHATQILLKEERPDVS